MTIVLLFSLILNSLFAVPSSVHAASSPWSQTNWNGGSGQTSWSDATKFSSSSNVTTSTANQLTLTNSEKFSNTGFESNLSSWNLGAQPDSISGLKLWLKADAITGLSDGNSVTTWTDSSGNSNDATQSTAANKPTYKTSVVNGQPVVRFDGNDDIMDYPSAGFPSDPATLFVIYKPSALSGRALIITKGGGNGVESSGAYYYGSTVWSPRGIYTSGSGSGYFSSDQASLFALTTKMNSIKFENGSDNPTVFLNGTSINRSIQDGYGNPNGYNGNLIGKTFNGDIAEIIVYNSALSDSDRQSIEAYLQGKYAISSGNATLTRDTTTTYSSSAGSAKLVTGSNATNFTQSVNVGDTNTYNLVAYAYTDGSAVTSPDVELFYNGSTITTTYTSVGSGWYKLTGTLTGANASRVYGVQVKANKTVYVDNFSLNNYASSGTLTSSIFDTGFSAGAVWGALTYNTTTPSNTSVSVKARTSNSSSMTGATAFSSCAAVTSGSDISSNSCVTDSHRYIQYQLTLSNTDSVSTPTFQDVSIAFATYDATAPSISLTALSPDPNSDNTPTLSGTATESLGTVSNVQFQMDSTSGSWSSCTASDGTFNSASEAFSCTATTLTDGSHTMYVRATDSNSNTTSNANASSDTFTIDATAPTLPGPPTTTNPTNNNQPTWTWTASTDATAGLALSPYTVQWSQSATFASGNASSTAPTSSFIHSTALADGTWYFQVKAKDLVGNESNYSSASSVNINTQSPSGSLTINSQASYTNTRSVTLTMAAADDQDPSTSLTMKTANTSDLTDAVWETYSTGKAWTLPTGDGSKAVYVRFRDSLGNESGLYSDTITLDTTAPKSIGLDSPGDNSYTNAERPTFKWKTTTDATAGLSKYVLEVDNPSIGSSEPSGDFSIDNIPTSRTTDYETNKYTIHYENFNDSDSTNNYIAVYTKSHSGWSSSENDGKLREGRVSWKIKAVDNAGNETSSSRTLLVDRTSPNIEVTRINSSLCHPVLDTGSSLDSRFRGNDSCPMTTTDKTPTIYGQITDPLAGGDSSQTQTDTGPRVASGPKQVEIKVEKKDRLIYRLISLYTINLDKPWWTCNNQEITDNSKQWCDSSSPSATDGHGKYLPFEYTPEQNLTLGTYKVTITGLDRADNPAAETSLILNITPIVRRTPPEAKQIIEPELKELPKEDKEEPEPVQEELIITGPAADKIVEQVATEQQNLIDSVTGWVGNTAKGAGQVVQIVFNTVYQGAKSAWQATGQAIAFIGTVITPKDSIANALFKIGEKVQDVSDTAGLAIVEFGYLFVSEPTGIADVKVVRLTATSATIFWTTNHPANGKVNYGLTPDYGQDVQSEKRVIHHEFTITNFEPGTTYYYEVMSHNKNYVYDANHTFTTPEK